MSSPFFRLLSSKFCSSSLYRGQTPGTNQGQTAASGPQGAPGDGPPVHFPTPPGMMSPDMQNAGLNQSPPNMCPGGPPMMGSFGPGDGPPHLGIGPPGPPSDGNFFNNFFNQDDMKMDGMVQEGESEC